MTCRIVIADDEPLAIQQLRTFLSAVDWVDLVGEATNGPDAIQAIDTLKPDLVFLDIRMPGASGLQVVEQVEHDPYLIFTTAYDRYAVTAFELQALDYLLKPFGKLRFNAALERARQALSAPVVLKERSRYAFNTSNSGPLTRLFVRTQRRIMPIVVDDIVRLEAHDDYVMLHLENERYLVNVRMKDFEKRLDQRFARVHRSHIVNLDYIVSLEPYDERRIQIELQKGKRIIASRAGSKLLRGLVI
ncbi:MAG: LytTR family DNA-binding domain-containing protein [Rhodothermaceae bacterium]|nr:LytTR family DNA-binding domain-containing protein [Rhodothermaceae bacterium]